MNQGKTIETNTVTDREPRISDITGRLGMDYELNKKTILGVLVTGNYNRFAMTAQSISSIYSNQQLDTSITIFTDEEHSLYNYGANLNLQHTISENEKVL
jgi:hypothetical protein